MKTKNIDITNDEKITIIFNHTGCFNGSINVFVNDYNATGLVAKDLGRRTRPNGSINGNNECYMHSYGHHLARQIQDFYEYNGDIKVFETTY